MPASLRSFTDAAADAVARSIAAIEREARRERELREAQFAARMAELDLRFAMLTDLERQCAERIASVKDGDHGRSVTVEEVAPLIADAVERAVSAIPAPKDGQPGKDADPELIERMVAERVATAVAAIPSPENGKDAAPELIAEMVERAVAALPAPAPGKDADPELVASLVAEKVREAVDALPAPERGERGPVGQLPMVREWADAVHYEGDVVTHAGATFQALRDTAKEPPHDDWICLAGPGRDGVDGRSFNIRETWKEDGEYLALDVVALNGASFAARYDNPGACPGEGWQIMSMQGKRGAPGEPGKPGPKGDTGHVRAVAAMRADETGLLTIVNADGTTVECDLYPLLSKIRG